MLTECNYEGDSMTVTREQSVAGLNGELNQFETLIRSISAQDWKTLTRCEGWTAQDVASHVTGQLADIVNGRFDGLGTPEMTQRQVDERRGKSPDELADELSEAVKVGNDIVGSFDDAAWSGPPRHREPREYSEGQ